MIRSDEQASRRSKAKPDAGHGIVTHAEGEPVKACVVVMGRLATGRWDDDVRGLGIPVGISAGVIRSDRGQRCRSSDESGESRWSEGRQGIGIL